MAALAVALAVAAGRAKGLTLRLGADARKPSAVAVDAATAAAQLKAGHEVAAGP
jgi:hypothetical protein